MTVYLLKMHSYAPSLMGNGTMTEKRWIAGVYSAYPTAEIQKAAKNIDCHVVEFELDSAALSAPDWRG